MNLFKSLKKKEEFDLETLLKKATVDAACQNDFLKKLLSEKLIVIAQDNICPRGYEMLLRDTDVDIFTFKDGKVPFFTSTDRIFDNCIIKKQVKFIKLKGEDLFKILKGKTLVLNPNSDFGKEFLPEEIESLLDGSYFTSDVKRAKINRKKPVKVGEALKYPRAVVQSLNKLFSGNPDINAAYLAFIHEPLSDVHPHYIFAIDAAQNYDNIISEAMFLTEQLIGDKDFDFIRLNHTGGIDDYFVNESTPFYKR